MSYYIKVLMVDDDPRYTRTLPDRVYNDYQIEVTVYSSWEEARAELLGHPHTYSAVILDALGKIDPDDSGDNEKHITKALNDLAKSGLNIPHFVLTGYFDKVSVFIPDEVLVFKKNSEEDKLFEYIKSQFASSEKNHVARKYPELLDFVEKNFNDEEIKGFVNLYLRETLSTDVFSDARMLRLLNEKTVDVLGIKNGCFENIDELITFIKESGCDIKGGSRTIDIIGFFSREIDAVPKCIETNIRSIYYTCSAVGSHSRKSEEYVPTPLQIEAFKYQLLETMTWVKNYLETNIR